MILVIVLQWALGILACILIGGAAYLGYEWYQRSWHWDYIQQQSFFEPDLGSNGPTIIFVVACALALIALAGLPLIRAILSRPNRVSTLQDDPRVAPMPISSREIRRPDGSLLHVEFHGPPTGPTIIATHGWGLNCKEWNPLVLDLARDFRLVIWDLAGLGHSTRPTNRDFSLEKLAGDLKAVLECSDTKSAVLMGHSIGGMTTLTFCRLFPEDLGKYVEALILTHTTPLNPVRTTMGAAFLTVIEKVVLHPLMHATIALSPVLRIMNVLSFLNGTAHLANKLSSFAGTETWEQIDFATRFQLQASPAVLARGMLGMMRYDAMDGLSSIGIPTLVVAGDKDSTTKPVASELICKGIPRSELKVLSPAKHLGLIEHHQEYAAEVRAFVNRVIAARV